MVVIPLLLKNTKSIWQRMESEEAYNKIVYKKLHYKSLFTVSSSRSLKTPATEKLKYNGLFKDVGKKGRINQQLGRREIILTYLWFSSFSSWWQ